MTYAGIQMFMEKLNQLINSNHNPFFNYPDIKRERPQFQLLYDELESMIQTLFTDEHQEDLQDIEKVNDLKQRFIYAAEEAQYIVDRFLSGVHIRNTTQDFPTSEDFSPSLNLDDVRRLFKSVEVEFMSMRINNTKMNSSRRTERTLDQSAPARRSKKVLDEIFVGIDHDAELIRDKLVEDQKKLDVVSIVGMGGIGKTTLATKVFNDDYVKYHFDVRVWVTVSQTYDKRVVLTQILESIRGQVDLEKGSDSRLLEMILEFVSVKLDLEKVSDLRFHETILESISFHLDLEKASDPGLYDNIIESIRVELDLKKACNSRFRKIILESIYAQLDLGKASDPGLHEKIVESICVQLNHEEVSDSDFRKMILKSINVQLDVEKASDPGLHETILESIGVQLDLLNVSDSRFRKTILRAIRVQLDVEKASDSLLREMVHKLLMGRRYLIVIDDIWHTETWHELKVFFPHDNTGSRILLTSRLTKVAKHAKSNGLIHHLDYLNKERSWELLCKKVFHGNECPEWSIKPGMQIAESCHGLPLAVVVIAGVLAKEASSEKLWAEIAYKASSYIVGGKSGCLETLALSCNQLPPHLRDCFFYFGGFPEDYVFQVQWLIWLWVAEGFIQQDGNRRLEDIAEGYLMDLIGRNLVIVTDRRDFDGGVKACKVHDLVRELCLQKAKEERFILQTEKLRFSSQFSKPVHMFINIDIDLPEFPYPSTQNLQTIFCFSDFRSLSNDVAKCFYSFLLLKVLDLQNCRLDDFPCGMELLVHLTYLAIWNESKGFPSSICNLWNLQTLIYITSYSIVLPSNIIHLVNLRHLWSYLPSTRGKSVWSFLHSTAIRVKGAFFLPSIEKHMNLQTISCVVLEDGVDNFLKCFPCIKELTCDVYLDAENDFRSLTCLEKLKLTGWSRRMICQITFPTTLKSLTLVMCLLPWSDMSIIQSLPNLQVLKLKYKAFRGSCWSTNEQEFRQLQLLRLESLDIKVWEACSTSFPCLRQLEIYDCKDLEEVPLEIGEIPTLKLIKIKYCSRSVKESVRRVEEEQHESGNYDLKIDLAIGL